MSIKLEHDKNKQAMTSFCMSRAILEDYAKTIARIEGRNEEEVVQRVRVRTRELMKELSDSAKIDETVVTASEGIKQDSKIINAQGNNKISQSKSMALENDRHHSSIVKNSSLKQPDLFASQPLASKKGKNLDMTDGDVIVFPDFFSKNQSDLYFKNLLNDIKWRQDKIKFYGKEMPLPRLTAWYGETDKPYSYSGIPMNPDPWTPDLLAIKSELEKIANVSFSSVLLNLYRDGKDSVSWHSDDEKELGENATIASVSFGDTRTFQFKHKYLKELPKVDVPLSHGSVVIMQGTTQHYWQHQIPKTSRDLKERINLTFRVIK
ncbi:alpha-ketoglutarate-dependent dioxygenase AlkB family protein [Hymenobacter psychrophilus]|uniref:Alkylated DNA repair dioxygenase AlkB n=1 Tax=Hymenobacter psychrophilus TaxID=651662 RepID=A0A1H3EXC1_9BACT|nr:alpha-ketoglutarate-dependent dioxygenase AlkB [Hymenobacter psychrophilus]SDX83245.1 Alkylated DNA repair dioxygenase AlkB [Hymenobacter psychrophilus]